LLRRAFAIAERARTHGNHPFGAILVDHTGTILYEIENGYLSERDRTSARRTTPRHPGVACARSEISRAMHDLHVR